MIILGLNYLVHEASAALLVDGEIKAAVEEERFSRVKFDKTFPSEAVRYCLKVANLSVADLDHVAFSWKPTYFPVGDPNFLCSLMNRVGGDIRGLRSIIRPCKRHIYMRMKVPVHIRRELGPGKYRIHFVQHHQAHAASAFYVSGFSEAVALSVDGHGEWEGTTIAIADRQGIRPLRRIYAPHSLGFLYAAATRHLGFRPMSDEYKVMGLASYGKASGQIDDLIRLEANGGYRLDLSYFELDGDFFTGFSQKFVRRFGPPRQPNQEITEHHQQFAATVQALFVKVLCHMGEWAKKQTGFANVVVAGGCGLNGPANYALVSEVGFKNIFVQPAASDAGTSLGAAFAVGADQTARRSVSTFSPYLGPAFPDEFVEQKLKGYNLCYVRPANFARAVARLLNEGHMIGHFNGRMEWGPRALGNRSILADPRQAEMKDKVNKAVKFREGFRPFAPAVILERAHEFFDMGVSDSPYMTLVVPAKVRAIEAIPAVVHVDGTCRVQTVARQQNPLFYDILSEFGRESGVPILLNTSFNVKNEPIVCTPDDAVRCFFSTGLDFLAIGSFVVGKSPSALRTLRSVAVEEGVPSLVEN
jgi:carbamoyltransferase